MNKCVQTCNKLFGFFNSLLALWMGFYGFCTDSEPSSKGLQVVKKWTNVFKHAINYLDSSIVY